MTNHRDASHRNTTCIHALRRFVSLCAYGLALSTTSAQDHGVEVKLRVLPEFASRPERYRVELFRMSADDSMQSVAELGGLAPEFDNFVSIFVDAARLQAGQYRLTIAGDPDTDARDKESAFILRMRPALDDRSATSR